MELKTPLYEAHVKAGERWFPLAAIFFRCSTGRE